jgi:hypothetical protein
MRIGNIGLQGVRIGSLMTLVVIACGFASLFAYWSWVIVFARLHCRRLLPKAGRIARQTGSGQASFWSNGEGRRLSATCQ